MKIDERNIEVIDDEMAKVLREKTPQERLAIAFGLWTSAKRRLTNYLRSEHPDWSESMVQTERGCEEVVSWSYLTFSNIESWANRFDLSEIWETILSRLKK